MVTGGAGFIGSNLIEHFIKENRVVCLDNLITGNKENIQPFLTNRHFEFIEGDIRNLENCVNAVKGVDVVLHHAALGSVPRSIENPLNTNEHNITGFLNILEAARKVGVKRVIYASSSSVYGDDETFPKIEDETGNPLSPYAVTKVANELYARVYADLFGMELIGLRYFNVFGKNQDPAGSYAAVIPKFISRLTEGKEITVYGDGTQSRDFTHVANVVRANDLAASSTDANAINQVYNVAYGATTSLNDLVELIITLLAEIEIEVNRKLIVSGSLRKGEIKDSFADIGKITKNLAYSPVVTLEEGLRKTIPLYTGRK